jgi:hypothetical protein
MKRGLGATPPRNVRENIVKRPRTTVPMPMTPVVVAVLPPANFTSNDPGYNTEYDF